MTNSITKKVLTLLSLISALLFFSFPTQSQALATSSISGSLPKVVFTAAKKVVEPPFDITSHTFAPDGTTSTISIPDLGVSAPLIYANSFDSQSSDWNCLKSYRQCPMRYLLRFGILHLFGTPQPGDIGNSILVGHSSCYAAEKTQYCKVLAKLNYANIGSKIVINYSNGRQQTFEVTDNFRFYFAKAKTIGVQMDTLNNKINAKQRQINTTRNARTKATYEKQLNSLNAQLRTLSQKNEATNVNKRNAKFPNERMITLETCWPLGTATDRWIVQAKLLEDKMVNSNQ